MPRINQTIHETCANSGTFWKQASESIIPDAHASTNRYPIHYFKQPLIDVNGGSGWSGSWYYNVDGDNQLESVTKIISSSQSMTRYVLEWHDEDHPIPELDTIYDQYRIQNYGGQADVETFVVLNGVIQFDGIWDDNKVYGNWAGAHGDKDRTYSNGVKIFANTWNHALDICDNNTGMTKYTRYF